VPIALLAMGGFIGAACLRGIDPLLQLLATEFNVSVAVAGGVMAAYTLAYGLFQLVMGPVGDRLGKLDTIAGAMLALALANLACAFAPGLAALTTLRFVSGAAAATIIPTTIAFLGDSVPYAERQATIGRFLTGNTLAMIIAAPIGGAFGDTLGWRGVFVTLALVSLAGGVGLTRANLRRARAAPATPEGAAPASAPPRQPALAAYRAILAAPAGRRLMLAAFLDGMFCFGSFPFLAPFLNIRHGLSYTMAGIVLGCFGIGATTYTRTAGILVRKLGEVRLVLLGAAGLAAGLSAMVLSGAWLPAIPAQMVMGFAFFCLHGVLQARATELLPEARATALAAFAFNLFVGQATGAVLAGAGIERLGFEATLLADAALILALGIWIAAGPRRGRGARA